MRTDKLCEKFAKGETTGKANSCFIEGNVIYSYGSHFPMALRLQDGYFFKFILNKSKYSNTTSKHQSWLKNEINDNDIANITTQELKNLIVDNPKNVSDVMLNKLKGE